MEEIMRDKMGELDQIKKNAGITENYDPEINVQDFGGLALSQVVDMIKQDASKLDPRNVQKKDILFIRNASAAIARLYDRPSLMDSELMEGLTGSVSISQSNRGVQPVYKVTSAEHDDLLDALSRHPEADLALAPWLTAVEDSPRSPTAVVTYMGMIFGIFASKGMLMLVAGGNLSPVDEVKNKTADLIPGLIADFPSFRLL